MTAPLLQVSHLSRHYTLPAQRMFAPPPLLKAVKDVSLYIRPAETLGLVGESGCGKSTLGRILVGIDRPTAGEVAFDGADLFALDGRTLKARRRDLQMIFQNPLGALDPRMRVGRQVREAQDVHEVGEPAGRDTAVLEILAAVGLEPEIAERYPHQLSGGQAQRVVIARAISLRSRLLVCDEPVSALDVSVQARVIALLAELQERFGLSFLFISHDLRIVKRLSHRIAVMYLGRIVEEGPTEPIYRRPYHPYTKALLSAVPEPSVGAARERLLLKGEPPSPIAPPAGCEFHTRCPFARERCRTEAPALRDLGEGRKASCHFAEELSP
jgi:oligopeptide/dipeptide ABC transporter ATP-binding protein